MNDSFDPAPYYATICASDYKLGVTGVSVAESGVVLVPQVPVAERLTFLKALKEFLLNLKKLFPDLYREQPVLVRSAARS